MLEAQVEAHKVRIANMNGKCGSVTALDEETAERSTFL
jgi:hypothetical protein